MPRVGGCVTCSFVIPGSVVATELDALSRVEKWSGRASRAEIFLACVTPFTYSLVRKVLTDQEVLGKNIGSNKCIGTSVCKKPEVQILVPVHELSPDFC